MNNLPMNSILEELRCMDGELFRSELTQRLYILLKTQAQESINLKISNKKQLYSKILEWPASVRDEELAILRKKSSEIDSLFTQVALLYVKLSHKAVENRTVRIRTPRLEDMVKTFYQNIISNSWCVNNELWNFDPIKLDFVLRECFRKAVMDSVQVIQNSVSSKPVRKLEEEDEEVYPEDSISNFLQPSKKEDSSSESSKSSKSSESSSESELEPSKPEIIQENATIIRDYVQDNATVYGKKNSDTHTVQGKNFSDTKTVTFKLPKSNASVTSSVSEDSSNSKYLTAVKTQPKFIPIIPEQDSDDEENIEKEIVDEENIDEENEKENTSKVLKITLQKNLE